MAETKNVPFYWNQFNQSDFRILHTPTSISVIYRNKRYLIGKIVLAKFNSPYGYYK